MAAGDLTDLASVKAWLDIPTGTTASDALLSSLITSASTFIKQYLNSEILSAPYTETRRAYGHSDLVVSQGPISAVSSVAWDSQSITQAGNPLTGAVGFLFDGRTISLVGACFPYRAYVVVAYTAGYATTPADIQQACNEIVGEAFKRRDRIGQNSKSLGGGVSEVISFSTADMNQTTAAALNPYRNVAPV